MAKDLGLVIRLMTRREVNTILNIAVDRLAKDQVELLQLDASERSMTHHLACCLSSLVPTYDVDVEYNRHGNVPKRLALPHREALDCELRATTVFPDILVHKRNSDADNLLVIEVKKPSGDLDYDTLKLRAFRDELGYANAAHLVLGLSENGDLIRDIIWVDD